MNNSNNENISNEDFEYINFQELDVIKYVIDKYRSVSGAKAIDALLYSIYMGTEIVKKEQKSKIYTLRK